MPKYYKMLLQLLQIPVFEFALSCPVHQREKAHMRRAQHAQHKFVEQDTIRPEGNSTMLALATSAQFQALERMLTKMTDAHVIYIAGTRRAVWDAITDPELSKQYWGHSNSSTWKKGEYWGHFRVSDAEVADVSGVILQNDPLHKLELSWLENGGPSTTVLFELDDVKGVLRLRVTHDCGGDDALEQAIDEAWPMVLSSMKSFIETGTPLPLIDAS